MQADPIWTLLAAGVPLFPALAAVLLGSGGFRSERTTVALSLTALTLSLASWCALAVHAAMAGFPPTEVMLGNWFRVADYGFELSLLLNGRALVVSGTVAALNLVVAAFAAPYLHRELGIRRFFFCLAVFATGMQGVVLGGSLDLLFAGWELVGLSSALLIGFFHERSAPVRSGLRAFVTYRVCDIGLLVGTVLLHHVLGTAEFLHAFAPSTLDHNLSPTVATAVGLCLLFAACGKAAQLPFGGWLTRAMEGPTPSSALFYGGLSVNAGVYLLLRASPLLERAPIAAGMTVAIGAFTALYAGLAWRAQPDVKGQLALATMGQTGVMFIEIGLGFTGLATVHLVASTCVRTWQLLRSPNTLAEALAARAAHGGLLPGQQPTRSPSAWNRRLYSYAFRGVGLDALTERWLVTPFFAAGRALDRLERRVVKAAGEKAPHGADSGQHRESHAK